MALVGLEGRIVEVEADIGAGLPRTVLVGLPDSALYQARDRCKAAVSNSGQEWPISLLTINLSPATLPKAGSHYDLAIVAAILAAQGIFRADELRRTVLLGELGLDGRVRPIRGVLPATLAAQQAGFTRMIVPLRQAGEAKLVAGIDVFGIASITQLVAFLRGEPMPLVDPIEVMGDPAGKHAKRRLDLADVVGQVEAKWACEVAAAGRHHMLFHGPPGVGKTMLAERVPGLLPDLDLHDSLEVSAVHSLAGFNLADELITRPPYSDPHHSASVASIVGGGQRMARPGAISCAHKGVLFLDDSTEAQSIRLSASSYRPAAIGQPVSTFYDLTIRKLSAATVLTPFAPDVDRSRPARSVPRRRSSVRRSLSVSDRRRRSWLARWAGMALSMTALPLRVSRTRVPRRSLGSGLRCTRPASASRSRRLVIPPEVSIVARLRSVGFNS